MVYDHSTLRKQNRSASTEVRPGSRIFHVLKQWLCRNVFFATAYPSTVIKIRLHDEVPWPVKALKTNDRIYIAAGEVVPCDSILATDTAIVDYSLFTDGYLVERRRGELIYAGGRIVGERAILKVHEAMTPKRFVYLLKLRKRQYRQTLQARQPSVQVMLLSALSTFLQRIAPFGKTEANTNGISTGTVHYEGLPLSENDMQLLLFATSASEEPYARAIGRAMQKQVRPGRFTGKITVSPGEGIAIGHLLQLGNAAFTGTQPNDHSTTEIWLRIDSLLMGKFVLDGNAHS